LLCNVEFAFRYEVYQNIAGEDLVQPDRKTDLFKTQAYTVGLNYYIKGNDAKVQLNFIDVDDPEDSNRGLREVHNNVIIAAFQVGF
jgi:phosphate-selective porin